MHFQFYREELATVPKLSMDGVVPNSIHLSHWQGNQTPPELKADTSTGIALNLVRSPCKDQFTRGIELLTNNHFDTDGVLSVWTMLAGPRATELEHELVAAAEAGDFGEFPNDNAVRASIVLQGADQAGDVETHGSPLAYELAGSKPVDDDRSYTLVLPEVEDVLRHTENYERLWRGAWELIDRAVASFEKGLSRVDEYEDMGLSVVLASSSLSEPEGVQGGIPRCVISRYARGSLYLIAFPVRSGWSYRIDYPYYSWAETVVRPRVERRRLGPLINRLNDLEKNLNGRWAVDSSGLASAVKLKDGTDGGSSLPPEKVVAEIRQQLSPV